MPPSHQSADGKPPMRCQPRDGLAGREADFLPVNFPAGAILAGVFWISL